MDNSERRVKSSKNTGLLGRHHSGLQETICVGGADGSEGVGGSRELLMRCSKNGNLCFQKLT